MFIRYIIHYVSLKLPMIIIRIVHVYVNSKFMKFKINESE